MFTTLSLVSFDKLFFQEIRFYHLHKPCESIIYKNTCQKVWNKQKNYLSLHLTRLAFMDERVKTYWKRTFTNVIFDVLISQLELSSKERNRNFHVGCIVFVQYIIAWANSSYLSLERSNTRTSTWDKREVVTPTSLCITKNYLAKTGEDNRQLLSAIL